MSMLAVDEVAVERLEAFRRGEEGAVRALYAQYGRLVFAVAHRVLGRHDLAEEAVQHTFVKAWQAAERMDVTCDPAAWLATIARRAAIDIYRRETCRPASPLAEVAANHCSVVTAPPDLVALDAVWHVRRAIGLLPFDEATVVRLQHLDGMTQIAVAQRLGIPLGTVKTRSRRAHRHLATLLGHLRSDPDA